MAKAHIIPKAFMRRANSPPFMESDGASWPIKRFTGWYDQTILGSEGERRMAALDDVAAKCFVGGGYTYRTRRDPNDLTVLRNDFVRDRVYEVENVDAATIRLFALSLLWRAAVSGLDAMRLVQVRGRNLAEIGRRILRGDPGSPFEFPVYFGLFCGGDELPKIAPFLLSDIPFVRFFLDGVVAYVCPRKNLVAASRYGKLLVGTERDRFPLWCYASTGSAHAQWAEHGHDALLTRYGDVFAGFR